jgi:hypothetical protein
VSTKRRLPQIALAGASLSAECRQALGLGPIGQKRLGVDNLVMERILSLTCPNCGAEFASAMQIDAETWAKIRVENNIERCSVCGFSRRYQKGEYFFT